MTNNVLGRRLKEKRKEHKLTQQQLADKLEVTLSVVSGAETKRGISKSLALKLSNVFDTDVGYWLNEDAEKEFIEQCEPLEMTKTVVKRLLDEKILTICNIDDMESDTQELLLQALKFDMKIFLKKKGN